MSLSIPFIPRLGRLATAIGLGFSLLAGSLAAPAPAQAEGEIRIAEQFGICLLYTSDAADE